MHSGPNNKESKTSVSQLHSTQSTLNFTNLFEVLRWNTLTFLAPKEMYTKESISKNFKKLINQKGGYAKGKTIITNVLQQNADRYIEVIDSWLSRFARNVNVNEKAIKIIASAILCNGEGNWIGKMKENDTERDYSDIFVHQNFVKLVGCGKINFANLLEEAIQNDALVLNVLRKSFLLDDVGFDALANDYITYEEIKRFVNAGTSIEDWIKKFILNNGLVLCEKQQLRLTDFLNFSTQDKKDVIMMLKHEKGKQAVQNNQLDVATFLRIPPADREKFLNDLNPRPLLKP